MKIYCPLCESPAVSKYNLQGYEYYFCDSCYLLFLYPQPSDKELDKYYKFIFSHSSGVENIYKLTAQSKKVVQKFRSLQPRGKTILDIGSGLGILLNEAHKDGLQTTAIEPSKSLVKSSIYKKFDKVYNCSFESYLKLESKNKYDFITLTHVIEHIKEPASFIKNVLKLLENNGILFIETPNIDSHLYHTEKDQYTFLLPPEHVILHSKKSLSKIIPKPYTIIEASTYSYPEHFMGIIKKLIKKPNNQTSFIQTQKTSEDKTPLSKKIKILFFDSFLARLLNPLLNVNQHGSILELYIGKE